jgi:uncharacterized membrane protein YccC
MNKAIHKIFGDLRALLGKLARDFAPGPGPLSGLRAIDEAECIASVLLAIAFAHLLDVRNVGWAAFSGYMVIRASFAESLSRGSLRVLGTAAGAALAWLLAPALLDSAALQSLALALSGAVTLYLALLDRRGYAWLFAGLTFAMVLIDGVEHRGEALGVFAQSRFIEVFVGTGASIVVSAVSALTLRRRLPAPSKEAAQEVQAPALRFWHQAAFRHALQGALALALIPWAWSMLHIAALSQASITIMAVMMVPVASLATSDHPATAKLLHRFFGCSIGGLLATAVLLLSHDSPVVMTLAVCFGVVAGRHIENGNLGIAYVGTQFALAFLVVLVPDSYTGVDIHPGLERLSGILFGMVLLEPVRLLFRRFVRWPAAAS